jgi:2-C-methyl-D-erythritol 4-phosphate cytidylyltransferase
MRYGLVMPAAGGGARFGGATPKQHLPLAGASVLETALRPFLDDARCAAIALVLAGEDPQRVPLRRQLPAKVLFAAGGALRSHSVLSGLEILEGCLHADDWVLVHDAARPCLSPDDLQRLLDRGADSPAGALLAAPVADTVKEGDSGDCVVRTVPRQHLWRALTPQMFRLAELRAALGAARANGREPTDESQAIEWQGKRPLLVAAADQNPKITTAGDLALAAAILASRKESQR